MAMTTFAGSDTNAVIVGNVQHLNHAVFSAGTFWLNGGAVGTAPTRSTNPSAIYGGVNDRELPHLVAPGAPPGSYDRHAHACNTVDTTTSDLWIGVWGTSFSAPVVNAIATNLMASNIGWARPEAIRAVMMATAINVDGAFWSPSTTDQKDGNGVISGSRAVDFTNDYTLLYPNNPSATAVQGLSQWSFDSTGFLSHPPYAGPLTYNITTPSDFPEGKHLRVVLTWSGSPGINYDENEISDWDLLVTSDGGWYSSQSWNGNVEVVDIPAANLSPDEVYSIVLTPWAYRKAVDGPVYQYFALAWAWVDTVL